MAMVLVRGNSAGCALIVANLSQTGEGIATIGNCGPISLRTASTIICECVIPLPQAFKTYRQSCCRSSSQHSVGILSNSQANTGVVGQRSPSRVFWGGENDRNRQRSPAAQA